MYEHVYVISCITGGHSSREGGLAAQQGSLVIMYERVYIITYITGGTTSKKGSLAAQQ